MGNLEQEVDLGKLQQGIEYRNRFRENMRWTALFGVSAVLLLIYFLTLEMRPRHRSFYVSSTEGTVIQVKPVDMSWLEHSQSTGGDDVKSSSHYGS